MMHTSAIICDSDLTACVTGQRNIQDPQVIHVSSVDCTLQALHAVISANQEKSTSILVIEDNRMMIADNLDRYMRRSIERRDMLLIDPFEYDPPATIYKGREVVSVKGSRHMTYPLPRKNKRR